MSRIVKDSRSKKLKKILKSFKILCEEHNIDPPILYIPSVAHIYAKYSTLESGSKWLRQRQEQIHREKNLENTLAKLTQELDLDLINLSPAYEASARQGKMLYYALDSHWNAEGREVAAIFVAEVLRDKFTTTSGNK